MAIEFDDAMASSRAWPRTGARGEVLTLAYMNAEALRLTRETGEVHFFSRSRQELWHKGETSGNVHAAAPAALRLRRRRAARAGRAGRPGLPHGRAHLLLPRPRGATASTVRGAGEPGRRHEALAALERTLRERRDERPEGSYTAELLGRPGADRREGARGGRRGRSRRRAGSPTSGVAEEAADVLYHLEVLLHSRELPLADALEVLNGRRR